jgi:competence protein ComEC
MLSKSKIFLYFCLSFIAGVAGAPYFNFSSFAKTAAILVVSIFIFAFWRSRRASVFSFCFIIFILGIWRYDLSLHQIQDVDLAYYNDKNEILFEGVITDEPDVRTSQTKLTVAAKKLYLLSETETKEIKKNLGTFILYEDLADLPQKEIFGKALLNLPRHPNYKYGDYVLVFGKIAIPKTYGENNFSYEEYLSRYQIYSVSYYPKVMTIKQGKGSVFIFSVLKVKERFEKAINKTLPEPHAAFLAGLLFGAKKAIPEYLLEKFNYVGLTHIVVVSGYNITIIAAVISALFLKFFSRKSSFLLSLLAIFLFVILVGAGAPVIRAAIMGIFVLLAKQSGRLSNITNSLAFTACVMLLVNPKILALDLGFQLSFLATIGIVYLSPYLEKFVKWLPEFFEIRETTKITLSAQILVIPKILLGFSKISTISLFANILVLPVIPITMFFGFATGVVGQVSSYLAKITGYLAYSFLNYEIAVVEFFAKFPWASVQFEKVGKWGVWGYFAIIIVIYAYLKKKEKMRLEKS